MDKEAVYALLEDKLVLYRDLVGVPVADCGEKMVALAQTDLAFLPFDKRMEQYTGKDVYVREGLVQVLQKAQAALNKILPGHVLQVFYGYRHLEVQRNFYADVRSEAIERLGSRYGADFDEMMLKEIVHRFVAVPEVSGHPTGGAVDVCVLDPDGHMIDMGTARHENSKDSYVFSPFIGKTAWDNRQKLRFAMMQAGFCPFDGEWWHFSYGDREWAFYYKKDRAIYAQIEFSSLSAS